MINLQEYLKNIKDNFYYKVPEIFKNIHLTSNYEKLTPYKGFDSTNLNNGRQNNYAWAMCDFNGYIYVGTGRNLPLVSFTMGMTNIKPALDYSPETDKLDMTAEIWRYKKDGSLSWERVYKGKYIEITNSKTGQKELMADIIGFRSFVVFDSFNIKPAIYAAAYSTTGVKVLKSTNGSDWFDIKSNITGGTSSRSIIQYNNKLYMAVMNDGPQEGVPSIVYSSQDPELEGWTLVTPTGGQEGKNPIGVVWSMAEFNNRLYLGTASKEGFMVWRTNGREPKLDDWTLVIDKGGGDAANGIAMSLKAFKDYLYVGTAYDVSDYKIYITPKGADIFRIKCILAQQILSKVVKFIGIHQNNI